MSVFSASGFEQTSRLPHRHTRDRLFAVAGLAGHFLVKCPPKVRAIHADEKLIVAMKTLYFRSFRA